MGSIHVSLRKLLQNLSRVARETGAKIVLSSDWRRHPEARAEAQQVLTGAGLELIGCTPCDLACLVTQSALDLRQKPLLGTETNGDPGMEEGLPEALSTSGNRPTQDARGGEVAELGGNR